MNYFTGGQFFLHSAKRRATKSQRLEAFARNIVLNITAFPRRRRVKWRIGLVLANLFDLRKVDQIFPAAGGLFA